MKMKPFKFFSSKNGQTHFMSVTTWDTNTTYNIPTELYQHVVELGMSRYHTNENLRGEVLLNILENPMNPINNLILVNEINVGAMYQFRLVSVEELVAGRLMIYYWVSFPDSEDVQSFRTIIDIR